MMYQSRRTRPLLLVVDDDDVQRLLYREALEPSGFDIVEAIRYLSRGDKPVDNGHIIADLDGPRFQVFTQNDTFAICRMAPVMKKSQTYRRQFKNRKAEDVPGAAQGKKDAQHMEVVLRESRRIVRMDHGVLIAETKHGFICANAGVDESNVNGERELTLLPADPDRSARELRTRLQQLAGADSDFDLVVIISDTWGRPWRNGQVNMAIGVAGIEPIADYRGQYDPYGYELQVSAIAVADELAAAAELVMGKVDRVPVALIRGYSYIPGQGDARSLLRDTASDMFR